MKSSNWRVSHPHGLVSMLTLGPALISSTSPLWGAGVEGRTFPGQQDPPACVTCPSQPPIRDSLKPAEALSVDGWFKRTL